MGRQRSLQQPQAGSQHLGLAAGRAASTSAALGASQQAGAQQLFSQHGWQQASLAFSSANRQRWHFGAHSQPQAAAQHGRRSTGRAQAARGRRAGAHSSLGGLAAGRGAAALLAARMAAGQLGLQPLQEVRTAALRHAAASRLTALGGFAASRGAAPGRKRSRTAAWGLRSRPGHSRCGSRPTGPSPATAGKDGSSSEHRPRYNRRPAHKPWGLRSRRGPQQAGAAQQPGPPSRLARAMLVVATTLKANKATADNRKRRFMGVTPCDKDPMGKSR